MDRSEYKKLRQTILKKYDSGTLTERELGEELFHSTTIYRRENNIAKRGSRRYDMSFEKIGADGVGIRKKPNPIPPTNELYYLYKEKKMANHNDDTIAKYLQVSKAYLSRHKNKWIKKGWLKVIGSGSARKVIFNK